MPCGARSFSSEELICLAWVACSRDHLPVEDIPFASTSAGVRKHGRPVSLDDPMTVDLVMVGSVAVNPANGCRIGKGEVRLAPKASTWPRGEHS